MGAWRHALGREKSALTNIGLRNIKAILRGSTCIKTRVHNKSGGVRGPPRAFVLQGSIDNLLISLEPVVWVCPGTLSLTTRVRYVIPRVADLDF